MNDKELVKGVAEAFTMPVVFHPGGWEDTVPEYMRREVVIRQRLEMLFDGGWDRASDVEVVCYMNTASLVAPLTEQWTRIYLYEAGLVMPAIREYFTQDKGSLMPEELTEYDRSTLNDLKFKIRNSQVKRRKEIMGKLKVIIDERDGAHIIGIWDKDTDPVITTVPGDMAAALAAVPGAVAAAQEKWKSHKKNPAYTPPVVAKKPAPKPVEKSKPVADLPLLPEEKKEPAPAAGVFIPPRVPKPPVAEAVQPVAAPAAAPASTEALPAATPEIKPPEAKVEPEAKAKEQFFLEDGRGPFDTVQAAFDALGLDKATRPTHNRYDRLSAALKAKVIRK